MREPTWDETTEVPSENKVPTWENTKEVPRGENISELESGLRGAAQGASMGFADEGQGGIEALWEKAKGDPGEFGNLYKKFRDESREKYKMAETQNPNSYLGGQFTGGVATAIIPGLNAVKGASLLRTVGQGALQGGLTGLGSSESEDPMTQAKDAGMGAGLGGAIGLAGEKILSPLIEGGSKYVGKGAQFVRDKIMDRGLERTGRVVNNIPEEFTRDYIKRKGDIVAREMPEIADELVGQFENAETKNFNAKDLVDQAKSNLKDTQFNVKEGAKDFKYDIDNEYNRASGNFGNEYNSEVNRLKEKTLVPLRGEVESALHELKDRVSKGSSQSYEILEKDPKLYDMSTVRNLLSSEMKAMGDITSDTAEASIRKLQKLEERLIKNGGWKTGPEMKNILQQLDHDLESHYASNAGEFSPQADQIKSKIRSFIRQDLVDSNPDYGHIMKGVAEDTSLLNMASKMFGNESTALSRLSTMGSLKGKEIDSVVLKSLGKKTGIDFETPLNEFYANQELLKNPDKIKQGLPSFGKLQELENTRMKVRDPEYQRGLLESPEILSGQNALSKAEQGSTETQGNLDILKEVNPRSVQSKMKSLTGARDYMPTKAFEKIDELTGKNYTQEIRDRAILDSFQKGDPNGARKTLTGALFGRLTGGKGGELVGGLTGFSADKYAGQAFQKVLDARIYGGDKLGNMLNSTPQVFGKFAPILKNAATRGPTGLGATHFILEQTNPEYQKLMAPLKGHNKDEEENQP